MISRAASRTSSERPSSISLAPPSAPQLLACPLGCRYPLHRGAPSLGPVAKPNLVDLPIRRRCTPTFFPATLGLHRIAVRWQGDDHTPRVPKNHVGRHRWTTDADVVQLVTALGAKRRIRRLPRDLIAPARRQTRKRSDLLACVRLRNRRANSPTVTASALSAARPHSKKRPDLTVSEATGRRSNGERIYLPIILQRAPWVIRTGDLEQDGVRRAQVIVALDGRRLKIEECDGFGGIARSARPAASSLAPRLAAEQQREPFLEFKRRDVGSSSLVVERLRLFVDPAIVGDREIRTRGPTVAVANAPAPGSTSGRGWPGAQFV